MGNWVEESALQAATGDHRYAGWVPPPRPADDAILYARKKEPPKDIDTFTRVFAHSDNLLSTEWHTTAQAAFQPPSARDDELRKLRHEGIGSRTAALEAALMAEASQLPPGEGLTAKPQPPSNVRPAPASRPLPPLSPTARSLRPPGRGGI